MFSHLGFGEGELATREQLNNYLQKSSYQFTLHDRKSDGKLFGFTSVHPSAFSRSASPLKNRYRIAS